MKTGERAVLELDCRFSHEGANNPTNNPPLYLAPLSLNPPPSHSTSPSIKSPLYINMLLLYTVLVCVIILSLLQLIVIICIADFMSN